MNDYKPKISEYNGFIFKSLLEKKWAIFFENCGYRWIYEPEWFMLSEEIKYLPDFYIKDLDLYVETKPFNKNIVNHVGDGNVWEKKCERFRDKTGKAILLCYGYPYQDLMKALFAFDCTEESGGSSPDPYICNFVIYQNKVVLCTGNDREDRIVCTREDFTNNDFVGTSYQLCGDLSLANEMVQVYDYNADDYLNKAKSAAWKAKQYE